MNHGLLRFHDATSGLVGQDFVEKAFAPDGLNAEVFAFDWLARQFAVTDNYPDPESVGLKKGDPLVVMLSPFDMSITPWVLLDEFERALNLPLAQEELQEPLFQSWLAANRLPGLDLEHCAGATVPAFYQGTLTLDNLTYDNMDVYLSFAEQLWNRSREAQPTSAPRLNVDI